MRQNSLKEFYSSVAKRFWKLALIHLTKCEMCLKTTSSLQDFNHISMPIRDGMLGFNCNLILIIGMGIYPHKFKSKSRMLWRNKRCQMSRQYLYWVKAFEWLRRITLIIALTDKVTFWGFKQVFVNTSNNYMFYNVADERLPKNSWSSIWSSVFQAK
jgi:hypothetical protein